MGLVRRRDAVAPGHHHSLALADLCPLPAPNNLMAWCGLEVFVSGCPTEAGIILSITLFHHHGGGSCPSAAPANLLARS